MKITTRTILKITRLYKLADDQTSSREFRNIHIENNESFATAEFVFCKKRYVLFFGSELEQENLTKLHPTLPTNAQLLENPLDNSDKLTPFQGKIVALYLLPDEKIRLDIFMSRYFDTSRSRSSWQKYIKQGLVKVNGKVVNSPKSEIDITDEISVESVEKSDKTTDVPIIFEDEDVVVLNKPTGMLTHAKGGISQEFTVADLLHDKTTFGLDTDRAGIVHRLDRETSGIIIGARNEAAAKNLQKQFANRTTKKTYIAIVEGIPKHNEALIDLPIGRSPAKPSTFRVDPKGKSAQTAYKVLASKNGKSLVELRPKTGRTHQLRVHMAHIGNPIVGDIVYGKPSERMFLHAYQLEITLPSGKRSTFKAPLPDSFLTDFPEVEL